ncbi:MAG: glycyl-radical enzyme activating protein [Desulfosarcina sp.]|nr:glycyl-radical enzyme activating protein [Desulfosarcina sp.]MBC2742706.1 glycyl-radical enzyme activating protein [Desulfosarcina sp.]MBC2765616.1 glycyl-radical enzyme activating protein [Desulfosarcina sp.]
MKDPNQPDKDALIFNIQRFCLHDGPGIRTTLFFKGCPLHCAWCQNPESIDPKPEMAFIAERCRGCFQCADACEADAIIRSEEKRIDHSRCTACGRCAEVCPSGGLTLVGRRWTVDTLVAEVLKDRDFFVDSGGGITLSGGEPMLQGRFLEVFLPAVKEHGIHVNLETCGCYQWEQIEPLLPFLDLIYFDLKHMDPTTHRHHTGVDNGRILDNFARLTRGAGTLVPRMPIVPGINDTEANVADTARFLLHHGHDTIHGLPYHGLGADKLRWINSPLRPLNLTSMDAEACRPVGRMFAKRGINAVIYD